MRNAKLGSTLLATIAFVLAAPRVAHAYIDPVSGSVLLQVLAAGALATVFMLKRFWASIKSTARRFLDRFSR